AELLAEPHAAAQTEAREEPAAAVGWIDLAAPAVIDVGRHRVADEHARLRTDHDRDVRPHAQLDLRVHVGEAHALAAVGAGLVETPIVATIAVLVDHVLGPAGAGQRAPAEADRVDGPEEPVREVELGLRVLIEAIAEPAVEVDVVDVTIDVRAPLGDRLFLGRAIDRDHPRFHLRADHRLDIAALAELGLDVPLELVATYVLAVDRAAQIGIAVAAERHAGEAWRG